MKLTTLADLKQRQLDEIARGPAPVNPFTHLREYRGLTIAQLSRLAHIDEMALTRAEYGTYTEPLPSLVDYWCNKSNLTNELDLRTEYDEFVSLQRDRHKFYFGRSLLTNPNEDLHPFRQLRARRPSKHTNNPLPVGLVECSRALCVPLDTIQFWEKKLTQKSVPKPIKVALNQVGYTSEQIRQLESSYLEWRDLQSKLVRFS